jgi:hypothetical protein
MAASGALTALPRATPAGSVRQLLDGGIYDRVFRRHAAGEEGHQAPSERYSLSLDVGHSHDRDLLRGRDIV